MTECRYGGALFCAFFENNIVFWGECFVFAVAPFWSICYNRIVRKSAVEKRFELMNLCRTNPYKAALKDCLLILFGGIIYAVSTVLFIFPHRLLLGGTSGVSVILESFLPFSPGTILVVINVLLLLLAFLVLGKGMAAKTFLGSIITTLCIGVFEKIFSSNAPLVSNPYFSAAIGAFLIAFASGIMFYVDSSSGGTDIIALIVQKFSHIQIGKALLLTDVLIVVVGGLLSGSVILFSSFIGLLIKTLGIDLFISLFKKMRFRRSMDDAE